MYNFFLLCVLTCVSGMHHTLHTKQDIRNPFRFQSMSRRSNSPDSPLKEGNQYLVYYINFNIMSCQVSNVTGVDLKYVVWFYFLLKQKKETLFLLIFF
jgi:hypothetical protein